MTATQAVRGLPDWAKLFGPMALTLLLAIVGFAIQWGVLSEARRSDRALLERMQVQITAMQVKVDGMASIVAVMQQGQAADDRRLSVLEVEAGVVRRDAAAVGRQLGAIEAALTAMREEQASMRRLLEQFYRERRTDSRQQEETTWFR